jgi:glycosyltransferase involved in cell wall biosynthesis
MRVVVNALSARRGGIITYTRNLMQSFRERSVEAVFALPVDSPLAREDVETVSFSVTSMSPISRAVWEQVVWRRIVRKLKPDILYSSANFGLIRSPVPQVLLVREGGLFDPVYLADIAPVLGARKIFERILRRRLIIASARASNLVLTPTDAMGDLLSLWAGDLTDRMETNLYGTRLDHFGRGQAHRAWRQDGVLRVLMVSAYYAHKQPGLVSEAVRLLNEGGIRAHFTLTMDFSQIEQAPGGYKDAFLLRRGVERGEVTMLGQIDYGDLPAIYSEHDVFVTPSLSETFGHPLVEAMASGTLIAASDTQVHREVCDDAADYFAGTSVGSIVDALRTLDAQPARREAMLARARELGDRDYSWDSHVDRLLNYFEVVSAGS